MSTDDDLKEFSIINYLYMADAIHPAIDELAENFKETAQLSEIDSVQLENDPLLKAQFEWIHLMVDYYRRIPQGSLNRVDFTHQFFSHKEIRQFVRVNTAEKHGAVILHSVFKDVPATKSHGSKEVLGEIQLFLDKLCAEHIAFLNSESNRRELDRLEAKAGKACNAREWHSFNAKEVGFLRSMIAALTGLQTITSRLLEFKSDTGFYELSKKALESQNKKVWLDSPFLNRLMDEDPDSCDAENCLQRDFKRNNIVLFESGSIELTVLNSGYEWKGFIFSFDKKHKDNYEELLRKRRRSSYNKYFILSDPEESTFRELQVFGLMRVSSVVYPDCRDDESGVSLYLSVYIDICNDCGKIHDGQTWCCEYGCVDFPSYFNR